MKSYKKTMLIKNRYLTDLYLKGFVSLLFLFSLFTYGQNSFAAEPLGCIIEPERISNVGSQTLGVVESIKVERGDHVSEGQVLATLRSNIEKASVKVANTRSHAVAEMRSAKESLKLARMNEKRAVDLVSKKFVSQQALDKARAETAISKQKLASAKEQLRIWDNELSFARAQLNERTIRAPFDGIIADRFVWPGERVEEKPLFRIASINPLRVEMVVSAALYGTITKDMYVNVTPLLPNTDPVSARVTLVDQLIDGPSNTFRIRAEIPNDDFALPSGIRCKATLPDATETNANTTTTLK